MPLSPRNVSIGAALFFSLILIGLAYYLSSPYGSLQRVGAQSSEEILRAYAKKDADDDGLYDWQESLYGTDPLNPESVQAGKKDGDAVAEGLVAPKYVSELPTPEMPTPEELDATLGPAPAAGSLTEQFSREFIEAYLAAGGAQVVDEGAQTHIVEELLASFTQEAADLLRSPYSTLSIRISPSATLDEYAFSLATALVTHDVRETRNPLELMQALVENNDSSARVGLREYAASYANIAQDLLAAEVPSEQADAHLALIQSFDSLAKATELVANYEEDPIATLGAVAVYQPASQVALEAMNALAEAIVRTGEPAPGTPQAMIVRLARLAETP